MGKEAP